MAEKNFSKDLLQNTLLILLVLVVALLASNILGEYVEKGKAAANAVTTLNQAAQNSKPYYDTIYSKAERLDTTVSHLVTCINTNGRSTSNTPTKHQQNDPSKKNDVKNEDSETTTTKKQETKILDTVPRLRITITKFMPANQSRNKEMPIESATVEDIQRGFFIRYMFDTLDADAVTNRYTWTFKDVKWHPISKHNPTLTADIYILRSVDIQAETFDTCLITVPLVILNKPIDTVIKVTSPSNFINTNPFSRAFYFIDVEKKPKSIGPNRIFRIHQN